MSTVLVIGASRGIGLEFARQYAADGARVIGTVRRTEDAAKLRELGARPVLLDVVDEATGGRVRRAAARRKARRCHLQRRRLRAAHQRDRRARRTGLRRRHAHQCASTDAADPAAGARPERGGRQARRHFQPHGLDLADEQYLRDGCTVRARLRPMRRCARRRSSSELRASSASRSIRAGCARTWEAPAPTSMPPPA